jgi:hypothetical protein
MIVLSRSKNAASMSFIVSVAGRVPEQGRNAGPSDQMGAFG